MHLHGKILKGTSFLSAAEVVNQGCSLVRNVILARFLTKADFGVAALLGMVLTLFELSSKMALSQQIVQSKHGDEPGFVAGVQLTQFAAGTISALLILAAAWPLAHYFSGPQYLLSIMALAFVPFVNGLNNLDIYRYTRRLQYGPQILADNVPQVITTLAAWPLAAFFRDYRAVLVILLSKAILSAAMTHLLAEHRYSLRSNSAWFRQSLIFGWPLLLSGFIQFGNFQGDSMVVAGNYPLAQLGVYSIALTMAMTPGFTVLRIASSLGLPLLSEFQNDPQRFTIRYSQFAQGIALIGSLMTLAMMFCGEQMVVLLFGTKYAGVGALACLLTAAQSLRILRGAPVTAAMARGDTVNNLVSSSWRLSGLLLAIIVGFLKASLTWFAFTALAGEIIALTVTIFRLSRRHSLAPNLTFLPGALGGICVLLAAGVKWMLALGPYSIFNWFLLAIFSFICVGVFALCFPALRITAVVLLSHLKAKFRKPLSEQKPVMFNTVQEAAPKEDGETLTIVK